MTYSPPFSLYRLRRAANILAVGGVVGLPTEAVWGLSCLPGNVAAVNKLFALKQRDPTKGLVLVADSADRFAPVLAPLSNDVKERIAQSWPGPTTWLVPDAEWAPSWIRGCNNTVAIRVSEHPLVVALCGAADSCLVSTSANPAGREPARNQYQVERYFAAELDYYLPGPTGLRAQPSDIRNALTGEYLRGA